MDSKYRFTQLGSKNFKILTDKNALDYLMKWSIKGQLKLATFCFNEPFRNHQKTELVENFFQDSIVVNTLNKILPCWSFGKDEIDNICIEVVPCTISSLTFFDRIFNKNNNIIRGEGNIRQCLEDVVDGFIVADELRKALINQESDNFGLFNENDRNELIFRIFQFLVLGGKWCQYEDKVTPYIDLTKMLYKDLLRVEKNPETKEIKIKSLCLKYNPGTEGYDASFLVVLRQPSYKYRKFGDMLIMCISVGNAFFMKNFVARMSRTYSTREHEVLE